MSIAISPILRVPTESYHERQFRSILVEGATSLVCMYDFDDPNQQASDNW